MTLLIPDDTVAVIGRLAEILATLQNLIRLVDFCRGWWVNIIALLYLSRVSRESCVLCRVLCRVRDDDDEKMIIFC